MLSRLRSLLFVLVSSAAIVSCGRSVEGPQPEAIGADPKVVCGDQLETLIAIRGDGFSPAPVDALTGEPLLSIPQVTLIRIGDIDGSELEGGESWLLNEDPTDPSGDRVHWSSQEELTLRIDDELALERGVYDVHVLNPTGGEATLTRAFAAVPPPVLDQIEPVPVCTAQHTNTVVLTGSWFLTIGNSSPTVKISDREYASVAADCEEIDTPRDDLVQRCARLTIEMGVNDLPPGAHDVVVENPEPAHCQTTEAVVFHVVPPPSVDSVTEQPICIAEGDRSLEVSGSGFIWIGDDRPEVRVGAQLATLVGLSGCEPIDGLENVQTCTMLEISIVKDLLEDGRHEVVVTNPAPAHCHSVEDETLTVVPRPILAGVTPQPVCNAQGSTTVTLTGSGFLEIGGAMPKVYVGEVLATSVSVSSESCVALDDESLYARTCSELVVVFDEAALVAGLGAVRVENPVPAGCSSIDDQSLSVVPPPSLVSVQPNPVCVAQEDMPVTLIGSGFLEIDGQVGAVYLKSLVDGSIVIPSQVSAVEGYCTAVAGVDGARTCTRLFALIESGSLVEGDSYLVTVTNPSPADCVSTETVELGVVPPPDIDASSIEPTLVCMGGAVFTVQGTGLTGIDAYLKSDAHTAWAANVTVNEEGTMATLFFTSLQPGDYRLFVTGAGGCGDSTEGVAISVETGPTIFFVDPPVVFNGVAMRVSIYITRLSQAPDEVAILPSDRTDDSGQIMLTDIHWDPDRPNLVQATIPLPEEGPITPGSYDVIVKGLAGCDAFLDEGLLVVGETTIALSNPSIIPEFGEAHESVAVNIRALDEASRSLGEVGFEATPRAYLSSGLLATAEPLRAVTFESDTLLTAVVPGLETGFYDLIVVNPDGAVGFAADAFRATETAPPVIEDVFPTQVETNALVSMTIVGDNFFFDAGEADLGLLAKATCRDAQGNIEDYDMSIDVGASDSTSFQLLTAIWQVPGIHGGACVIRVENTTNDTFDEWSAVSVTNPATKLPPFRLSSELVEPRRAPAAAVGRATREARFVYAIGGDAGGLDSAKSSVEASSVGRFGDLGTWRVLQTGLVDASRQPTTRTLASAHRDGRFIFLLGGVTEDGVVVSDVLRSLVLDPLPPSVPEIVDVDIDFAGDIDDWDPYNKEPIINEGLERGAWTYMVSAIMADDDPENPAGETLPSEARTIYLPDVPGGMKVELTWTTVVGPSGAPAQAYHVYRTPHADAPIAEMHLIAVVAGTAEETHSYLDDEPDPVAREGAASDKVPLRLGALGTWHFVGELSRPRAAFGLAVAANPSAPGLYWYAIGGMSMEPGDGTLVTETSTYDYAPFDPDTSTIGTFTEAETNLAARREHAVWTATSDNAFFITELTESWVYVGFGHYGSFASPSTRPRVHYAKVLPSGLLGQPGDGGEGQFNSANPSTGDLGGMATLVASNWLYVLGGKANNVATNNARSAQICTGGQCQPPSLVTTLNQSAANDLLIARYLPGFGKRGAFFYLIGGADTAGAPLSSTEMNIR